MLVRQKLSMRSLGLIVSCGNPKWFLRQLEALGQFHKKLVGSTVCTHLAVSTAGSIVSFDDIRILLTRIMFVFVLHVRCCHRWLEKVQRIGSLNVIDPVVSLFNITDDNIELEHNPIIRNAIFLVVWQEAETMEAFPLITRDAGINDDRTWLT